MYISVSNAAEKFNISKRRLQTLCEQGRIDGAIMDRGEWLIPDTADKPTDMRKKSSISYSQFSLLDELTENGADLLTLEQVCELLSVSNATVKNWIRLGKLHPEADGKTFNKKYVKDLLAEIKSGKDSRLKSRRNKNGISGKVLYKDYIKNENNREVVERILNYWEYISEEELRIIIAHFAIQLYCKSGGEIFSNGELFEKNVPVSNNDVFNALIYDLIAKVDMQSIDLTNIRAIFNYRVEFVPSEDTLGFIYISLRNLSQRKQTGAYYTPAKIVNMLIDGLNNCLDFEDKTICDPCCGTGNFLIGLLENGVSPNALYGQDIDEISIFITRINMFLLNNNFSKEQLDSHFICGNTLQSTFPTTFSVILGNPPWGYDFTKEEISYLVNNYRSAKPNGMESYNLFIEKGLSMLEQNGYMAYVLPEAVLSVTSHRQARELIVENTSFKFVSYLGNVFSGVQCPAIILGLKKDAQRHTKQCRVMFENKEFTICEDRSVDASLLSLNINDDEYDCVKSIANIPNGKFLADNAKFAIGIVTGDNKKYVKDEKSDGWETVLRGSDIYRYSIKDSCNYIRFSPKNFQQVAPTEMYRAEEKLIYRFISDVPVFAYDDKQTLSLNSCNILIPQIEGMDIKYVLAVLNSSVAAFFITKKFNSVKLLRSHIEALPIPTVSDEKQNEIIEKVDIILSSDKNVEALYDELDKEIISLYNLSSHQQEIICNSLSRKNLFLP
ncbi:MAG: N-6 DNA methylase [Clostridia bacterium]|nr:N-6 DNA methylase [Clostridia bacterium]